MTISTPDGIGRRHGGSRLVTAVTPAAVFSAASGYVVLLLAARSLGAEKYEIFAVYWAVFFALIGILGGLSQETTRAVYSRRHTGGEPGASSPFVVGVGLGLAAAAVAVVSSPLWADRLIPGYEVPGTLLLAIGVASVGPQAAMIGLLGGLQRWGLFALLMVVDAVLRVGVAAGAAISGSPEIGFLAATVAGSVAWIVVLALPRARGVLQVTGDSGTAEFVRRLGHALWAGAATSVLLVGFPALMKATSPEAEAAALSTLILAVTLTRAPLLVPVTLFQSALVTHLVKHRNEPGPLAAMLGITAVVAGVGAWLAWLVGPAIMSLMGEGFVAGGGTLAALTLSAGVLAMTLLSGYAALAHERHRAYAVGWWLAVVVAVVVLLLPFSLETRVIWALFAGPLVGLCYHLGAVALSRRTIRE